MAAHMNLGYLRPQILKLSRIPCCLCSRTQQTTAQQQKTDNDGLIVSNTVKKEIVIPKRKKRDSLSILRALSSTVGSEPGSPRYGFIDDPEMLPHGQFSQKLSQLSKAAGRRTARFMVNDYWEAFEHDAAAPHIKAYDPDMREYKHTEPTEAALIERIELRQVKHAIQIYRKMKKLNVQVSDEVLESLLELLCVFNCQDPEQPVEPEERLYLSALQKPQKSSDQWEPNSVAEQVFQDMEEKTADAYNSIVRGLCVYKKAGRAYQLYEEMKAKNLTVYKGTYIELLVSADLIYQENVKSGSMQGGQDLPMSQVDQAYDDDHWNIVLGLLREMKAAKYPPCLDMFNAVLKSTEFNRTKRKNFLLDITLNEMIRLGIEPSLESWKHVIRGVNYNKTRTYVFVNLLTNILDHLEGKNIEVKTSADVEFFYYAMIKIYHETNATELAIRVNKLRESLGDLPSKIDSDFIYYKNFITLLTQTEPAEVVMEHYNKIVPFRFAPEENLHISILDCLKLHSAFQYISQIWEDMCLTYGDMNRFITSAEVLFGIIAEKKYEPKLQTEFVMIADQMFTRWQTTVEQDFKGSTPFINGNIIGYMIEVALNSEDLDKAWSYFEMYKTTMAMSSDRVGDRAFEALLGACISSRDSVKIMKENGLYRVHSSQEVINAMDTLAVPSLNKIIAKAKEELDSMLDDSQRNTIRVSNSLDPDQAPHFVGPDLGPGCLQGLSADDTCRYLELNVVTPHLRFRRTK